MERINKNGSAFLFICSKLITILIKDFRQYNTFKFIPKISRDYFFCFSCFGKKRLGRKFLTVKILKLL